MDIGPLALRARAAGARLYAWALRRARERSTWIGLGMVATAAGKSIWGDRLTSMADVIPMLLGAGGAALAAASTKPRAAGAEAGQ